MAVLGAACGTDTVDAVDGGVPPPPDAAPDAGTAIGEPFPPDAPFVDWFSDVTEGSGVDVAASTELDPTELVRGNGIACADVDGDGGLDLLVTRGYGGVSLYRNLGELRFADVTLAAGLDPAAAARGAALGDLDGDGDPDLALASEGAVRVLWNRGDGSFEAGPGAPPTYPAGSATGVVLADLDGDGLLDLYVPGFAKSVVEFDIGHDDRALRNRGDGSFEDISDRVGADTIGMGWTASAFDADGDADVDLYVCNDSFVIDLGGPVPNDPAPGSAPDRLFRNDGPGADGYPDLAEIGDEAGIAQPRSCMGAIVADVTGDGVFDLYASDYGRNDVLIGDGAGGFADDMGALGLGATWRRDSVCPDGTHVDCLLVSWGVAAEDFDHDGRGDLVVVNGATSGVDRRQPVAVWSGKPNGSLAPVQTGLGWIDGLGVIPADLDGDGDLDLAIATWRGDVRVFENTGAAGHWLRVRLRGSASNREGRGAVIHATLPDGTALIRAVGAGGIVHSSPPAEAHLGLGAHDTVELEVTWPSGFRHQLGTVAADQILDVAEPPLIAVEKRIANADGTATVGVTVSPAGPTGELLGPGRSVELETTAGTWDGPVADNGDGTYTRTLIAPSEPALAAIQATIDGAPLSAWPRVEFQ
jgi:hypothetical protein